MEYNTKSIIMYTAAGFYSGIPKLNTAKNIFVGYTSLPYECGKNQKAGSKNYKNDTSSALQLTTAKHARSYSETPSESKETYTKSAMASLQF